jgi:hypothetical protein
MNNSAPAERAAANESKWGYAVAGGIALAFAAVIQFAFGGLDAEMLENLPAVVTVPYGVAGKLGLTVPLAVLGLGLILRDVLVNSRGSNADPGPTPARLAAAAGRRGRATPPQDEGELEYGEPLPDEPVPAAAPKGVVKKIPAGPAPAPAPAPRRPAASAPPVDTGGGMVLQSAKYLNRNPGGGGPGNLRKGRIEHTKTDEE